MNAFDFVFPILAAKEKTVAAEPLELVQVYGTAFSIGGDVLVTACHVMDAAMQHPDYRVGRAEGGALFGTAITEVHRFPEHDLALLRAPVAAAKALRWETTQLHLLEGVQCLGYPYAYEKTEQVLTMRGFKGNIVAQVTFRRLPSRPRAYEVSFQAPRGLSGAPLWTTDGELAVAGVVIGNQSTEMLVFSSREQIAEEKELLVERFEALQMGLALQTQALLALESPLCNGTLASHLQRHRLLRGSGAA